MRIKDREIRNTVHSKMADDSKHSVLQLAPHLCENQRYNPPRKGTYPWQAEVTALQATRDRRKINDILEQRSTEVRKLYEQCQDSTDECRLLEEEWLALITAKDRNLRQQIEEENEETKRYQMKQLHDVLQTLGTFSFNKPNEVILKRNLAKMYRQIGKYCCRNNIDITTKSADTTSAVASTENIVATPPPPQALIPPPPPPPPLVLTPLSSNKVLKKRGSQSQMRGNGMPSKLDHPSTPCNHPNEELLKRIRNGCRSELRSTPFKRSPGGTPFKRQRRMSESDTSDLITVALKRKFQHTVFQSPKENESPRSVISPGDYNL